MRTVDEHRTSASADDCFTVAADVERWPELLSHYRWVRFRDPGVVEMAAWRSFGPLRYPTWWMSEMEQDPTTRTVRYRHIEGITRGMDVRWEVIPEGDTTLLRIVHEWSGPPWPVIGGWAAEHVIGPHFVGHIAGRTLAGLAQAAERGSP